MTLAPHQPSAAAHARPPPQRLPAPAPDPAQLAAGLTIGRYELIRLIGRGGMGEVYLARDLHLGRLVAIKRLLTEDAHVGKHILAEARATARCRHDNIVVVYEFGEHERRPYLVLEYIEGQTLRQWLDERSADGARPVPPGRAVEWMLPVARALAYAHKRGIVHRDLKPANIMISAAGAIKVLDFGVATYVSHLITWTGEGANISGSFEPPSATHSSLAGTLPYMSPEQMNTGYIDHRTDIWAVGIILFEMVAGHHPLPSLSHGALLEISDESVPMPSAAETLPHLGALGAIIDRCLLKDRAHRTGSAELLLEELSSLGTGRAGTRLHDDSEQNPFVGLATFQEGDSERFFGRHADIQRTLRALRSQPLVAIVGPSGTGKSSLIRAGVIPALKRSGEGWDVRIVRPGRVPLTALAHTLLQPYDAAATRSAARPRGPLTDAPEPPPTTQLIARLRGEPGYFGAALREHARTRRRRVLLFVDQFEELYTQRISAAERADFLRCLAAAADDTSSPLRVILTMRSDFLDRLGEDGPLAADITRGLLLLPALGREGLRQALCAPLAAAEFGFERDDIVESMVETLASTQCALPLLQFTAATLWELRDRERRLIRAADYQRVGGVAGALATHADAVISSMSTRDAQLARAVFLRLVTPERTSALSSLSELRAIHLLAGTNDDMDRVLTRLIEARLLAITGASADDDDARPERCASDGIVELVHESLISAWPRLQGWLDDNEDDRAMLTRLRGAAHDWERSGHADGLLWTGDVAREARRWQQHYQGPLGANEQRFLSAVSASIRHQLRVRRRLIAALMAITTLLALAMAWLAWQQSSARRSAANARAQAEREASRARDATRMAAVRTLDHDPTSQLALVRELEDPRTPPLGAVRAAKRLLYADVALTVFSGHSDDVYAARFSPDGRYVVSAAGDHTVLLWSRDGRGAARPLRGHSALVRAVDFSPDGRRVVSGSWDHSVRVWPLDGGEPLVLTGHTDEVWSVSFSPDGRRVASSSRDQTVRIWPLDSDAAPVVLRGHSALVYSVGFSPDGQRVVSASRDRTIRVWNAGGDDAPLILRGHDDEVRSAAFSPDGIHIASGSRDHTIRLWRSDGSGVPVVLRGHSDEILSVGFSPDGGIVSAGADHSVRLWPPGGHGQPRLLRGHDDQVHAAAASRDGRYIVSASSDKSVRIWPSQGSDDLQQLRGHRGVVWSAGFGPQGRRIASAGADGTIRIWHLDGGRDHRVLSGHDDEVWAVDFSPDGARLVSGSRDQTVRIWSLDGIAAPLTLHGHQGPVWSVAFSPEGSRVASAAGDGTVRIWRADGDGQAQVWRAHSDTVTSVRFSPDGTQLVTASSDKTVRVWRSDGSGPTAVLRGHTDTVRAADFSPDGRLVVSASLDQTVRLWPASGGAASAIWSGHDDLVVSVAFSPAGDRVASASKDGSVRVWPIAGDAAPVTLAGHEQWVTQARFSADGQRLVSASKDGTVRVWNDLAPVAPDDPRLWSRSGYCMPISRRIALLGVSEQMAADNRTRCREQVRAHHGAPAASAARPARGAQPTSE